MTKNDGLSETIISDVGGTSRDNKLKVAIIHPYLINQRGSERVLYALADLYPQADIFTLVYDQRSQISCVAKHKIITSFVHQLPFANTYKGFKFFMPLYPIAVEMLDLRGYDIVISNASGWMYGAITQPDTCHICILHGPFRFAWHYFHETIAGRNSLISILLGMIMSLIRQWDFNASQRVDYFVASSRTTQQRILKYYRRTSEVIYPPVDINRFSISTAADYFLVVSALVPYKRVDLVVSAFNILGWSLKVVGTGPELVKLRKLAKPNIEFVINASDEDVARYYSNSRALIFPCKEDFGIVPLESQASGRPVLAYKAGGALETICPGVTGEFFDEQSVEALVEALKRFQPGQYEPEVLRNWASRFDVDVFKQKIGDYVNQCWNQYQLQRPEF